MKPGAAAIKRTELAMEQISGRKKSKSWYDAIPASPAASSVRQNANTCGAVSSFTVSQLLCRASTLGRQPARERELNVAVAHLAHLASSFHSLAGYESS